MQPFLTFFVGGIVSLIFLKPVAKELKPLAPASIGDRVVIDREVQQHPFMKIGTALGSVSHAGVVYYLFEARGHL